MEEEWADIPGYEGRYQASSRGNIRSVIFDKPKPRKTHKGRRGYIYISLADKDGKRRTRLVHRCVLAAFSRRSLDTKEICNHIDLDKSNNNIENLEWTSFSRNQKHTWERGVLDKQLADRRQLYDFQADQVRELYASGFGQSEIARMFRVSQAVIRGIVTGKTYKRKVGK